MSYLLVLYKMFNQFATILQKNLYIFVQLVTEPYFFPQYTLYIVSDIVKIHIYCHFLSLIIDNSFSLIYRHSPSFRLSSRYKLPIFILLSSTTFKPKQANIRLIWWYIPCLISTIAVQKSPSAASSFAPIHFSSLSFTPLSNSFTTVSSNGLSSFAI